MPSRVEVRRTNSATDLLAVINGAVTTRSGLREGSPTSQIAVILRHPSQAAELEHELRRAGILYNSVGFTTYLLRPEVLFARLLLMSAVKLEAKLSSGVLTSAKRAMWEFLGGTLRTPSDGDNDPTPSIIDTVQQENVYQWVLPALLKTSDDEHARSQVTEALRLASSDRTRDLSASLEALDVNRLARRVFVNKEAADDAQASIHSLARAGQQYPSISSFLKAMISHDYDAYAGRRAHERIVLSSIEAAKGLEFDHVIVPDVNQGAFDGDSGDNRNLFYVAASRARHLLTLTHRTGAPSVYVTHYLG
jgi:DNA helicase-2/ATP-dependent DNA helicase PcrA